MKIIYLFFYSISILMFIGCHLKPDKNLKKNISDKKNDQKKENKTLYLYSVDSAFLPYMPDTNNIFHSSVSRQNYFLETGKKYRDFRNSFNPPDKTGIEIALAKRNADIMFDDYMDLINFKFTKAGHKNKETIALLSLYSPYSNHSDFQERLNLINSFPDEIKTSQIGKKTIAALDEYSNDKNIGLDFHTFSSISLTDSNSKSASLGMIFVPGKKFNIIMFGASWCLPCKLEELQLKNWIQLIDTSLTGITSFSIDKSYGSWKKYIHSSDFPWQSFKINGEMNNPLIKRLSFSGVPRNFLLDEKGVVLFENTDLRKIIREIPYIKTNSNYINN